MKKSTKFVIILLLTIFLIGGGIIIWKLGSSKEKSPSSNQKENLPPLNELSDQELEKCLLEDFSRRLDLKKYFVFNLQKEVKAGEVDIGGGETSANGRYVAPSLSRHLSRLLGVKRDWIIFQGKYTNESSLEWARDKLDEKINNGEGWYIIFDKTKINEETCNYFSKSGGVRNIPLIGTCVLAVESKESVWIKKNKSEALEFIKTDPALKKT